MKKVKALFVFCEGNHDLAFCHLIFKKIFNLKNFQKKLSEFPSPLNSIFKKNMKERLLDDFELAEAHKFYLPERVLSNQDVFVFLFNSGGKDKPVKPKELISNYLEFIDDAGVFPGSKPEEDKIILSQSDTYYLFIYDADEQNSSDLFSMCKRNYDDIVVDGNKWLGENFIPVSEDLFAAKSGNNKALYIWADPITQKGTLEDYIKPLIQDHSARQQAEIFVDETFNWDISKISEVSKRMKAIITIIGQRKKPGSSMNVMIEQAEIIPVDQLKQNELVNRFVNFISSFFGIGIKEG